MSLCTEELECKGFEFFQGTTTYCMQCRDPINTVPYQVNVIPTKTRYSMTIDAEMESHRQFSQNALDWSSFVYKKGTYAKEKNIDCIKV